MINKIIVPLDGSALAEKALPYATRLAHQLKAGLTLLRVEESQPAFSSLPAHAAPGTTGQTSLPSVAVQFGKLEEEEAYLQQVKTRLIKPEVAFPLTGTQVETQVVYGKSPRELATVIKEVKGDIVVMTTHGRSGLSLLMLGSIASHLVQHTTIPVILIRPAASETATTSTQPAGEVTTAPIVVTLDGSPNSEAIIEPASNLALQLGVKLHLLEVVYAIIPDGSGQLYIPPDYDPDRESAELKGQAEEYLKRLQAGLQAKGIDCTATVFCGQPAFAVVYNREPIYLIAEYARTVKAQLVAMATHARGRFWQVLLGSVSEAEVRQNNLPVMLVRMPGHHPQSSED
jgi:nucleotide-binding universal stress UspA family protein